MIAVLSHHPRLLLVGILLMTAMLWIGGTRVGLGTDDYHYLHALAPIEGIGSVLAAFVRADANPQYWRPLANASLMLDFVLYGWNGAGYHVTNLALHILATALVFGFARRILNADVMASSMAALIFGLSASHDSNLLWVAARADILASIFLLLTLLLISSKRPQNVALSGLTYFLALCSKELALLLLPFLGVLFLVKRDEWRLKPALLAIGYLTVVAGAFWMLRADFTVPAAQADPMVGEGMTSIIFALKNLSYGLGYLLLPLDLASATVVLSRFRTEAFVIGGAALVTFALMFRPGIRSMPWKPFIIAAALGLVFSVVVAQSFERWRLYMPSVGVYMMLALLITRTIQASGRIGRSASMAFLIGLLSFHTYRALAEQHSWTEASQYLHKTKTELKPLLADISVDTLIMLTRPSKIGGGSIMKVSNSHLILQAKAEAIRPAALEHASVGDLTCDLKLGVQVIALRPENGFESLTITKTSESSYRLSVPHSGTTRLLIETAETGSRPRERQYAKGDVVENEVGTFTVLEASNNFVTSVDVLLKEGSHPILGFDGKRMIRLR